jgi:hypothetical protein
MLLVLLSFAAAAAAAPAVGVVQQNYSWLLLLWWYQPLAQMTRPLESRCCWGLQDGIHIKESQELRAIMRGEKAGDVIHVWNFEHT